MIYLKLFEEFCLLLEKYISNKNIENIDGLNIPSEMSSTIGDIKMYFNVKLSSGYILVDFYQKNSDGSKDYSELPVTNRNEMMDRISKILSTASDAGVLSLISTNNKYKIWEKEEVFKGISFYPKRSSSDQERHIKDNKDSQRTKLYTRFLKDILGEVEVIDEGDLVKINFKSGIHVGNDSFYEDILKIPHIEEIVGNYGLEKYIKKT
jgi:hypothetical protein